MIVTFTTEQPAGAFGRVAADVADQLARWGYSALFVDWNFSAGPAERPGLADLVADRLDPLGVVATVALSGGGSVDAIMGGAVDRLPGDQWAQAYADGLADFLEDGAQRWREAYEIVVINGGAPGDPSRGIPVAHLADAVVVECHGAEAAALRAASDGRDLLPYGRAQLLVLPLHGAAEEFERWRLTWVHASVRPERVAELAAGDVRVLAALLANGFAGTELLVADPDGYVFAAENRDGVLEAARAVRPELIHLAPEAGDLDRTLRDLLGTQPAPVAQLRDVLVSDAEIEAWLADVLADPEFRPLEVRPARSAALPVRHVCPVDGNYVWYRYGTEAVPTCRDHPVPLEPAPLPRRIDQNKLCLSIADRVLKWMEIGDPGPLPPTKLEDEALDLLALAETEGPVATVAMSELQRAALLTGKEAQEARERALAIFALLRTKKGAVPEPLRADVDALAEDRLTVQRVAGGLWRAAGTRDAPGLATWAAALVAGPGLDAESLQHRVTALLGLVAETGDHTDLSEAVFLGRAGLGALPRPLDPAGIALAATTAFGMVGWHALSGDAGMLDEAIDLLRPLVSGAEVWPFVTIVLMSALVQRSSATGSAPDLTEAIDLGEHTLPTADGELLATISANLGSAYRTRFELVSRFADIDCSIRHFQNAVTDAGSQNQRPRVANLAGSWHTRYRYTRQLEDLRKAIAGYTAALDGADEESRLDVRANLADALLDLYHRTRDESVLWQASDIANVTIERTLTNPGRLATVAAIHELRAARTGDTQQRDEAIAAYTRVVQLSPVDDPRTAERVLPLIQLLLDRRAGTDRTTARELATQLVSSTRPGTLTWACASILLGDCLRAVGEPASTFYRDAAQARGASSQTRVQAAVRWARAAADEDGRESALLAWGAAIDALLRLASVGVDVETREHLLAEWANVPREAAAHAIAAGELMTALEFLEAGRTVLWNQSIDLRSEYSRLAAQDPDLAQRLTELATRLDHPGARAQDTAMALAQEWADLVAAARELPGFDRFLLRPSAAALVEALGDRTVVVLNVATTRCDALVVSGTGVRVIPLLVTAAELVAMAASMRGRAHRAVPEVVTRLWHAVARPVLDAVDPPRGSRLWWCPTGVFTMLPVHAAGTAEDSVHQRVVSSYTATVTALVRPAEKASADGPAVFVGVQHVPGSTLPDLPEVAAEARTFRASVHGPLRELLAHHATRAEVSTAVEEAALLHFACHARSSPDDPRNAGLELWDGRLTVREIAEKRTASPLLVVLSACDTAVGTDELADEVITIAAAFLVAGSRNVVGTLWPVEDDHAAAMAKSFYTALEDSADPAAALHTAVSALRDRHRKQPWVWAPYVHMGSGTITPTPAT